MPCERELAILLSCVEGLPTDGQQLRAPDPDAAPPLAMNGWTPTVRTQHGPTAIGSHLRTGCDLSMDRGLVGFVNWSIQRRKRKVLCADLTRNDAGTVIDHHAKVMCRPIGAS